MNLTNDQVEIAIKLRRMFKKKPKAETAQRGGKPTSYEHYLDFTRALAQMIDHFNNLDHPQMMQEAFNEAWHAGASYWGGENRQIILRVFGGNQEFFDVVKEHPNGRKVIHRILERVRDTEPGKAVDVNDILREEMDIQILDENDIDDFEPELN